MSSHLTSQIWRTAFYAVGASGILYQYNLIFYIMVERRIYSFLFTVSISEDIYNTPILNPLQN